MRAPRHLGTFFALFVLAVAPCFGQSPPPITAQSVTFPISANLAPVTSAAVAVVGNPGPQTYYYWIVTNYTLGASSPVFVGLTTNAPNALSGSNYVQVTPAYVSGIASVDLLRTTAAVQPNGTCNCAVSTGVTAGSINDQSNSLGAYTVNPFFPANFNLTLDNEPVSAGLTHLILRQGPLGTFVADLSVIGSAGVTGSGTSGTIPLWTGTSTQGNSPASVSGGTLSIAANLNVTGTGAFSGNLSAPTFTGIGSLLIRSPIPGSNFTPTAATSSIAIQADGGLYFSNNGGTLGQVPFLGGQAAANHLAIGNGPGTFADTVIPNCTAGTCALGYNNTTQTWTTQGPFGTGSVTSVSGTVGQISSTGGAAPVLSITDPFTFPGEAFFTPSDAGDAAYNLPTGVCPATPAQGDFCFDGNNLFYYDGTTLQQVGTLNSWGMIQVASLAGADLCAKTATGVAAATNGQFIIFDARSLGPKNAYVNTCSVNPFDSLRGSGFQPKVGGMWLLPAGQINASALIVESSFRILGVDAYAGGAGGTKWVLTNSIPNAYSATASTAVTTGGTAPATLTFASSPTATPVGNVIPNEIYSQCTTATLAQSGTLCVNSTATVQARGLVTAVSSSTINVETNQAIAGTNANTTAFVAFPCAFVLGDISGITSPSTQVFSGFGQELAYLTIDVSANSVTGSMPVCSYTSSNLTTIHDLTLNPFGNAGLEISGNQAQNQLGIYNIWITEGSHVSANSFCILHRMNTANIGLWHDISCALGGSGNSLYFVVDAPGFYGPKMHCVTATATACFSLGMGANLTVPVTSYATPGNVSGSDLFGIDAAPSGASTLTDIVQIGNYVPSGGTAPQNVHVHNLLDYGSPASGIINQIADSNTGCIIVYNDSTSNTGGDFWLDAVGKSRSNFANPTPACNSATIQQQEFDVLGATSGKCALTASAIGGTLSLCSANATVTAAGAFKGLSLQSSTLLDINGNVFLASSATAAAVDSLTITNAATANPATVTLSGTGTDANINVAFAPKGTGVYSIPTGTLANPAFCGGIITTTCFWSKAGFPFALSNQTNNILAFGATGGTAFTLNSTSVLGFASTTDATAAKDLGLSRDATASTLDIGTGAAASKAAIVQAKRWTVDGGTTLTSGAFTLGAGWGTTASIAITNANSKDNAYTITITVGGTGIAANPTLLLTFADGTWTNVPVCRQIQTGGNDIFADTTVSARSATAYTYIWNGTPTTAKTYELTEECTGT
jgi:hypothetical protein